MLSARVGSNNCKRCKKDARQSPAGSAGRQGLAEVAAGNLVSRYSRALASCGSSGSSVESCRPAVPHDVAHALAAKDFGELPISPRERQSQDWAERPRRRLVFRPR